MRMEEKTVYQVEEIVSSAKVLKKRNGKFNNLTALILFVAGWLVLILGIWKGFNFLDSTFTEMLGWGAIVSSIMLWLFFLGFSEVIFLLHEINLKLSDESD